MRPLYKFLFLILIGSVYLKSTLSLSAEVSLARAKQVIPAWQEVNEDRVYSVPKIEIILGRDVSTYDFIYVCSPDASLVENQDELVISVGSEQVTTTLEFLAFMDGCVVFLPVGDIAIGESVNISGLEVELNTYVPRPLTLRTSTRVLTAAGPLHLDLGEVLWAEVVEPYDVKLSQKIAADFLPRASDEAATSTQPQSVQGLLKVDKIVSFYNPFDTKYHLSVVVKGDFTMFKNADGTLVNENAIAVKKLSDTGCVGVRGGICHPSDAV